MESKFSSTAEKSNISTRLQEQLDRSAAQASPERKEELNRVKTLLVNLSERGLLRKQKYSALSRDDFERMYLHK